LEDNTMHAANFATKTPATKTPATETPPTAPAPHAPDPANRGAAIGHEADIGSGEKTPAERETEEMIKEIPPLASSKGSTPAPR
jgi:hypothetical protein